MAQYYGIDITEIDGFDNLHHAQGLLREAQERANRLYGAEETFYLVNGSTCGVLAAVMTVAGQGEGLLVARNCHKSVYHAAILQGLRLHYYYPPLIEEYGIYDGVSAGDIDRLLQVEPDCRAVVITSPTYEGVISDIRTIADVVHRRDKILIVDEAHGAHLGLSECMHEGAIAGGADLVIRSLHKTLPSMTQTALLHVQGERVDRRKLRKYLAMLQTSSPSYVMMASMDSCIRYIETHGAEGFAKMRRNRDDFCRKIAKCRHICIGENIGWDIGKVLISVRDSSVSGQQLYDILREEYHLQMEMAAASYVIAIMTIMDTEEGWQRLADALVQIDDRIEMESVKACAGQVHTKKMREEGDQTVAQKREIVCGDTMCAEIRMTPSCAFHAEQEEVPLKEAVGRIVGDFINLYPPGIPLLVPGEVMNEDVLAQIQESMRMGLQVQGVTPEGNVAVLRDRSI